MKKISAAFSLGLAGLLLLGSLTACDKPGSSKPAADSVQISTSEISDFSTMELVQDMGAGINLGNTFEACGDWISGGTVKAYETAWGSPEITQEMLHGYAAAGFGVLRIPVAWSNMMQDNYTIHPDYLARVRQVVDWARAEQLYVILNIHWDGGWWEDFPTAQDTCMTKYKRIWTQLCDAFADYDEHLMFESLNEEGCWNDVWNRYGGTEGKEDAYALLNEINQTFVNLVRGAGGYNKQRHLLIAGYATDVELTCDPLFQLPEDQENRCAVSVHYYTPSTFCILSEDADWGKAKTDWGSDSDRAELQKNMALLKTTFIDNDVPVIIGEFGVETKNKTDVVVRTFLTAVAQEAYANDLCPVLWDITGVFYDRSACQMKDTALLTGLLPQD